MLSATLFFSPSKNVGSTLKELGFLFVKNEYNYYLKDKKLIEATIDSSNCSLKLLFSSGLNLEEYTMIHTIILCIMKKMNANIDDNDSLLGYTSNGEGAHIVSNWQNWYGFLQDAKLSSLEGKKVRVMDENDKELASGMFVGYKADELTSSIIECTLITLFGERTYKGNKLSIQPTNEW
ncbi:hypothetical protein [Metabacillus sp. FJAT-53654]|uniref:Uncharacterized protein n=1 Tax=Metabacillus rhizosphaerae TaxID=3117747 RepID=A0ABZ2MMN3_9BACI